jgi:hypothetical protein
MAGSDELREFAKDLRAAGSGIASKVLPVVHKGANNIKRQHRREMRASTHFKGVAQSIDYSMKYGTGSRASGGAGAIEAEIGPRSGPGSAGALANIAYFGSSRGGGTVPDPKGALEAEAPRFEKALADVVEGLLK